MKKKNVLVDGSLRDAHWYLEYFRILRRDFPILRIGIIQVSANMETVLRRARKRAEVTGRLVPEEVIREAAQSIPRSVQILAPQTDFYASLRNEDNNLPYLEHCCMRDQMSKEVLWMLERTDNGDYVYTDRATQTQRREQNWEEK
jgi:hypothetical protein